MEPITSQFSIIFLSFIFMMVVRMMYWKTGFKPSKLMVALIIFVFITLVYNIVSVIF